MLGNIAYQTGRGGRFLERGAPVSALHRDFFPAPSFRAMQNDLLADVLRNPGHGLYPGTLVTSVIMRITEFSTTLVVHLHDFWFQYRH
jgi:hypothetical protein